MTYDARNLYLGKNIEFYWNDCMVFFRSEFYTLLLERLTYANSVKKCQSPYPE